MGENSPSSPAPPARRKGQKQKAWFLLLQKLSFVQPRAGKQFRVIFQSRALHSTPVYSRKSRAKALRFAVISGRHHCSRLLPLGNGFSTLFARQNNARLAAVCFIPNRKRCGIVLPLSQKSRAPPCDFREPCQTGLSYYKMGENSPSSPAPPARRKGQKQKAWFLLLQKLSFVQPRAGKQLRIIFQSRALHLFTSAPRSSSRP